MVEHEIDPSTLGDGEYLLHERQVEALDTLSAPTRNQLIEDGKYPKPVRIGERRKAWRSSQIREWMNNLPDWE